MDWISEVIIPLVEGNPGAIRVLIELHQRLLSIPEFLCDYMCWSSYVYKKI
jgi:hypothetical protein